MIGANDLFIGAHARSLDLTLVTNNSREFGRLSHLTLENWTLRETMLPARLELRSGDAK